MRYGRFSVPFGPITVARKVFYPSRPDRVMDPAVKRMQVIRSIVGLVALVWAAMTYQIFGGVGEMMGERFNDLVTSVVMLAVTFPVFLGVYLLAARQPARRTLLSRSKKPLGSVLAIVLSTGALVGTVLGGVMNGQLIDGAGGIAMQMGVSFGLVFWVLPFMLRGMVYSVVHIFRTADIHETVPPMLATLLVTQLSVLDLIYGTYGEAPGLAQVALLLGPPLSIGAVAAWELRRLRTRHGLTIRGALAR